MGILSTLLVIGVGALAIGAVSGNLGNVKLQRFKPIQRDVKTFDINPQFEEGIGFVKKAPALITEAQETAAAAAATAGQAKVLAEEARKIRLGVLGFLRNVRESS